MKHIALLLAISFMASGAQAAEYGLGVSIDSLRGSSEIFVPINVRDNLRFEPSVSLFDSQTRQGANTDKDRAYALKVGLFSLRPLNEGVNLLVGGRLGYQKQKSTRSSTFDTVTTLDASGPIIEPTLGIEYMPVKLLAIGAEAALSYSKLNDKSNNGLDFKTVRTDTKVTIKYFY